MLTKKSNTPGGKTTKKVGEKKPAPKTWLYLTPPDKGQTGGPIKTNKGKTKEKGEEVWGGIIGGVRPLCHTNKVGGKKKTHSGTIQFGKQRRLMNPP